MIGRRTLPALALAATSPARAQQRPLARRVAYVHAVTAAPDHVTLRLLQPHLRRLGLVPGDTLLLRSADGDPARLPELTAELVARRVAVILAVGAEALHAAAAGSGGIPVVGFDLETNPVSAGFARSLARPGGHVTGAFLDQPSLAAKWIDLLRAVSPGLRRIGLVWDPSAGREQLEAVEAQAAQRGLEAVTVDWRNSRDLDAAFLPFAGTPTGIVTLTAPGFADPARRIGAAVRRLGLPMVAFLRGYIGTGILMTYGPDHAARLARAMHLVERILGGATPAELPIELPTRFEFVLDLRVARDIGVEVPPTLVAQADEVLE